MVGYHGLMLESLRELLTGSSPPAAHAEESRERTLRLATGALLVEVGRADGHVAAEEREAMRAALESSLGLTEEDARSLLDAAERYSHQATSLYELTHELDRALSADEKARIVELLWRVVFADARKDPHEEQRVRQIAACCTSPTPTSSKPRSEAGLTHRARQSTLRLRRRPRVTRGARAILPIPSKHTIRRRGSLEWHPSR